MYVKSKTMGMLKNYVKTGMLPRLDRSSRRTIFALWPGLTICLLLLALPACQLSGEDSDPVVSGNSGTRDAQIRAATHDPANQHAVTQEEVDELWDSLSAADRQLLEENFQGKSSWDAWANRPDPGEAWDALIDEERAEFEKQGVDREKYITQQESMLRTMGLDRMRKMLQFQLQSLRPMETAPAGVERGTAMAWRELYALPDVIRKRQMSSASMFVGNFDSDADEEVALYSQGLAFVEQDGTSWQPAKLENSFMRAAWDYDGDGRDEICVPQPGTDAGISLASSDSQFLDMDGNVLGSLTGSASPSASRWTDLDGDGRADFVAYTRSDDNLEHGLYVFSQLGKQLFNADAMGWDYGLSGDVDGDGLDELLILLPADDPHQYEPRFIGLGQEPLEVVASCGHMVREEILGLLDFNGDGREDVVCNGVVYLSWNSEVVKLEMPAGYGLPSWNSRSSPSLHIWQRNGERLLAGLIVQEDEASSRSDSLAIWNAAGELSYLEHFGVEVMECAVGNAGQRLYVMTRKQLLVSD